MLFGLWVIPATAKVEFVRIWPGYRSAESLTSITEYFGGAGAKIHQSALRSTPADRRGYYWLARAKSDETLTGALFRLEVVRAGAIAPQVHEFTTTLKAGSHAVPIGITGPDWDDPDEVPVAWRITLISAQGESLAVSTSYLWQNANS